MPIENSSTDWKQVILNDLRELANDVHPRIARGRRLLHPQSKFDDEDMDRERAAYARKLDRFYREVSVLSVDPWIDIEYGSRSGFDNSVAIEVFVQSLGARMKLRKAIARAHRMCVYAPFGVLKIGMPNTIARQRGYSEGQLGQPGEDGESPESQTVAHLDEVPPGRIPQDLNLDEVALVTPEVLESAEVNDLPTLTNMSTPWVEVLDPRHIVTERFCEDLAESYYVAHLFLRTPQQVRHEYGYTGDMSPVKITNNKSVVVHGLNLNAFRPPTNQEVVLLAEVFVRQDPVRPELENLYGVMDLQTGAWIMPLGVIEVPSRFVAVMADTTSPNMWDGPSYLETVDDDISDAAFVRDELRSHVKWGAHDAMWIPEGVDIDQETREELENTNKRFQRRVIFYRGSKFDPSARSTRDIPRALLEYHQFVDGQFTENSGATQTSRGHGSSNKVATAFRQEASFMDKREEEVKNKLYDAYIDVILRATWLILHYGSSEFLTQVNGISFTINRDQIDGIGGYTINAVNRSAQDPLAARLIMVQQLRELFANPTLLQFFDPMEVAKLIAAMNGWPSRVLANPAAQAGAAQPPAGMMPGNAGSSGTPARMGAGVDSAGATMQDSEASMAGAMNRGV